MDDFIGGGGYNNKPTQEQINAKKWMKIIGIILGLLLLVVIALIVLMYYIQFTELKISVDGVTNTNLKSILVFEENGNVYVPIRTFAQYVGYESYSGDYKQYAEDTTKCYVESTNEIASFTLGSNKIYKILKDGENDYEYFEIDEPIKIIGEQLYTTIEGAQIAFNISMSYNQEQNQVTIYTLPYLVTYYTAKFQNSGIADNKADFSNQKALLYNMIVVKNTSGNYGIQNLNGQEILGTKYAKVKFVESTKEFIVTTTENKMGIMSHEAKTKISPEYDSVKQIDKNSGLYLATNNKKQGVINSNGNIVIYLEYDQIGIDLNKYASDKIKNQYLLYDKCIPAKKNGVWDLFDQTGKKLTKESYADLGCSAGSGNSNEKNTNNVLLIPEYEGIVVKKKSDSTDSYGLIDSNGEKLLPTSLKTIYSTISEGKETYYGIYGNKVLNIISYIEKNVRPKKQETDESNIQNIYNTNSTTATQNSNVTASNDTLTQNVVEQNETSNTTKNTQQ